MKVLLTGSTGFAGSHLKNLIESQGIEVSTMGFGKGDYTFPIRSEIDIEKTKSAVKSFKPELIIHAAGLVKSLIPMDFYRINVTYASTIFSALREFDGIKVVLFGSGAEYGFCDQIPITENTSTHPVGHYGLSKLAQTNMGRMEAATGLQVLTVRPFNFLGPNLPAHFAAGNFIDQVVKIMKGDLPPVLKTGNRTAQRDFVDIEYGAKAIWDLSRKPFTHDIVNICSGVPTSIQSLVETILQISNQNIDLAPAPSPLKGDVPIHYGCPKLADELLGYKPNFDLEKSLRKMLEFRLAEFK